MKSKFSTSALLIVGLVVALLVSINGVPRVSAAPAAGPLAVPTPVVSSRAGRNWTPVTFLNGVAVTADTRTGCAETAAYDLLDLQYSIDQGTTNTVTLKLQFTNDEVVFVDGLTIASANTSDIDNLLQFQTFGRYTCIYVDVTNSNPLTVTLKGIAK